MSETRVEVSELKREGGDLIKELVEFLREKTNVEVEAATDEILIRDEEKTVLRTYLRVILRKFLHKQELREHFRVISGRENTLIIKERKISKEE